MSPLSIEQKRIIAQHARRAYERWSGREDFERANDGLSKTEMCNAWRHVQQGEAVGIQSLCECTQAHYNRLVAHFMALAGAPDAAMRTRARDFDNDRRIARYKLDEALRERGLREEYAAAICRRQYRCGLADANSHQVWRLVFTIRNRRPAVTEATASNKQDPF
jgi:hypothetical protein